MLELKTYCTEIVFLFTIAKLLIFVSFQVC